MKFPLFSTLAFGLLASGLDAQTSPVSPAVDSTAAEWTQGFEAAEGYRAGQPAKSNHITVTGGTATILGDGGADGAQYLRFLPAKRDDSLVLNLPAEVAAGHGRSLTFAVRFAGDSATTRLALSYGETIALRPVSGGIEIEADTKPPQRLSVKLPADGWLMLGINENSPAGTWNLLVSGQPVLRDLPLQNPSPSLAQVLVFADGALDLDAVRVSALRETGADDAASGKTGGKDKGAYTPEERGILLSQALENARQGDAAGALRVAKSLARNSISPAARNLEIAQTLAMMAYALRDEGRHEPAVPLAELALEQLKGVRAEAGEASSAERATGEFIAAQLNEHVIGDWAEAERSFRAMARLAPQHPNAQAGIERLVKQRSLVANSRDGGAK